MLCGQVWLYLMCGGFLVLAVWAVVLFVRDIQRELRWGRVMVMMVIMVFFICCLWHWRHLVKVNLKAPHLNVFNFKWNDQLNLTLVHSSL